MANSSVKSDSDSLGVTSWRSDLWLPRSSPEPALLDDQHTPRDTPLPTAGRRNFSAAVLALSQSIQDEHELLATKFRSASPVKKKKAPKRKVKCHVKEPNPMNRETLPVDEEPIPVDKEASVVDESRTDALRRQWDQSCQSWDQGWTPESYDAMLSTSDGMEYGRAWKAGDVSNESFDVKIHEGCDSYTHLNYIYFVVLRKSASREEQIKFGVRMCGYLGYGGFVISKDVHDVMYFRPVEPKELEHARYQSSGSTLVAVYPGPRPPSRYILVPMGHYCLTAGFLRRSRWRKHAFPLDWSRNSFQVWDHMLCDDFQTLLCSKKQMDDRAHPYDSMFKDVHLFMHQGGWATQDVMRRTDRLRKILGQGNAFGLAIYFEGKDNINATRAEVIESAMHIASAEHGFAHIVLIWCSKTQCRPPRAKWMQRSHELSVLSYSPFKQINYWERMHPVDVIKIGELLETLFPEAFPPDTTYDGEQYPVSPRSSENDVVDEEGNDEYDLYC